MSEDYTILVQLSADFPPPLSIDRPRIEAAARQVLQMETLQPETMLSIVITTDDAMREFNLKYRGIDSPTDILSFPAQPLPDGIPDEDHYLGDIIIALPYTAQRAQSEGRDLRDELILLVVHGILHLLGYDHDTAENQKKMWAVQDAALQALNVSMEVPDYIHEDPST